MILHDKLSRLSISGAAETKYSLNDWVRSFDSEFGNRSGFSEYFLEESRRADQSAFVDKTRPTARAEVKVYQLHSTVTREFTWRFAKTHSSDTNVTVPSISGSSWTVTMASTSWMPRTGSDKIKSDNTFAASPSMVGGGSFCQEGESKPCSAGVRDDYVKRAIHFST